MCNRENQRGESSLLQKHTSYARELLVNSYRLSVATIGVSQQILTELRSAVVVAAMARAIRIEYGGAFYHVMARGNRRERIFCDDIDRCFFLKALEEACSRTGWRVHAWVLMKNHYHLMLQTPEPNLVEGMKWLQNAYTRRFNTRHRLWGRLFGDRYKAVLTEGRDGYYYNTLMDYIHLNPVRVGLVRIDQGESVRDYPWSSVGQGYALPVSKRPEWLAASEGLVAAQCSDTAGGRRSFVERLDKRAREEGGRCAGLIEPANDRRRSHLRHGWYWGSQSFAEQMLKVARKGLRSRKNRTYRSAALAQAHDEAEAKRLLAEGVAAAGLDNELLQRLPGSDIRKVALADLLLTCTVVRQGWIADQLAMRSAANVSQQVRRYRARTRPKLTPRLRNYISAVKIC
jgi:putative transposase